MKQIQMENLLQFLRPSSSLIENIIGGVLVSILTVVYVKSRTRLTRFHLNRVIGTIVIDENPVSIAYGQFTLPNLTAANGKPVTHPYIKPPRDKGNLPLIGSYSLEHPVSECEVRGATQIARLFGQAQLYRVQIIPDLDAIQSNSGSCVALGGPGSNYKTADILACKQNVFIRMKHDHFTTALDQRLAYDATFEHDHGFILRIRSPFFPKQSLIVCAGLGEWGTSGAAWFLANKWQALRSHGDSWRTGWGFRCQPDFLVILKVVRGQDDSATLVAYYQNQKGKSVKRFEAK